MTKNDAVGWIVLIGIMLVLFFGVLGLATNLDQGPKATVTCTSTMYPISTTCVRS